MLTADDMMMFDDAPSAVVDDDTSIAGEDDYLEEHLEIYLEEQRYRVRPIAWNETPMQLAYQRLRAEVFIDQLGWQLPRGPRGDESDRYDVGGDAITVYGAIGVEAGGREHLLGGVRIFRLRAWDDSMLPHEFRGLGMVPEPIMRGLTQRHPRADLLELTRLCVRPGRQWSPPDRPDIIFDLGIARDLCYAAAYLEAETLGRSHALAIVDAVYERVMRRARFQFERIHSVVARATDRYGYSVVLIDLPATIKSIRAAGDEERANRMVALCREKWMLS